MKAAAKKTLAPKAKPKATKEFEAEKHLRLFCDATSHELGTVLATIVGELDFALSSQQPAAKERSMMIAVNAAERALSLARNLRYFSVHTRLDLAPQDLSQILLDTVELVEKELELAKIKIAVLAEAGTCGIVDAGAMQQVILNLLANARKNIPGGGTITISLRQVEHQAEIRCSDSGPGISERELDTVFEPYAETENSDGFPNLGLAVCKALIESHGGDIQISSRVGIGTQVSLFLPFDPKLKRPRDFSEERRFRRIKLSLPANLTLVHGQSTLKTELTTLSIGGCYTRITDTAAARLPELNETVSIQLFHFGGEVLEIARARVASVSWAGIHSGIGIEFMELDPRAKKILTAIVKSHSA